MGKARKKIFQRFKTLIHPQFVFASLTALHSLSGENL
jgi:hypothetical protein